MYKRRGKTFFFFPFFELIFWGKKLPFFNQNEERGSLAAAGRVFARVLAICSPLVVYTHRGIVDDGIRECQVHVRRRRRSPQFLFSSFFIIMMIVSKFFWKICFFAHKKRFFFLSFSSFFGYSILLYYSTPTPVHILKWLLIFLKKELYGAVFQRGNLIILS